MSAATCALQPLRGAQATERGPRQLRAGLVVADEVTRPSGVSSRVCGLAASCRRAPKRSAWPRVSSSASGSASSGREPRRARRAVRDRVRARPPASAPRACACRRRGGGSCSAPRRAGPSAPAGPRRAPRARRAARCRAGARSGDDPLELGEHPLGGDVGEPRSVGARRRAGGGLDVELNSIARRARRMTRRGSSSKAVADTRRSRRASRSARPPNGSRSSPPSSGSAMALTVKSRRARSCSMDLAVERHQIDLPGSRARDHPPGAEGLGERERRRALRLGQAARPRLHVTLGDQVDIVGRAPEEPVAHAPPTTQTGSPASAARAAASARFTPAPRRGGRRAARAE